MTIGTARIQRLQSLDEAHIAGLAEVLVDCVDSGAGVSFLHPLTVDKARDFWRGVAGRVRTGSIAILVARDDSGIVGTVQLVLEQPENQPHRADLAKMLVHRRARRRGLGTAVLNAAEELARQCGKSLLVLDTNEDSEAERLYVREGWQRVGRIPDYSLRPRGGLHAAVVYYKNI
jgi:GNAT superfamily N-acetyltransferase